MIRAHALAKESLHVGTEDAPTASTPGTSAEPWDVDLAKNAPTEPDQVDEYAASPSRVLLTSSNSRWPKGKRAKDGQGAKEQKAKGPRMIFHI